ncbi:MAG TPA: NifU family protein [Bacteroidota bacterium]|nr:NifU family protein [Bacteroidota bacterium]
MNIESVTDQVRRSLDGIRHFLQEDGGDVELVRVREDGIVEVKLIGACARCPMSVMTLRAGIERALMRDSSDVKRVEAIAEVKQ